MKKLCKYIFIIILILCVNLIINSKKVEAALQSNENSGTTATLANWITTVRNMEIAGQNLGLKATINSTTLLDSTKLNNLDVHMEKNTEYGAMALLSASNYGNPSKVASGETSTGNESGVVLKVNKEVVSALKGSANMSVSGSVNARYRDQYAVTYAVKSGDAMLGWHGAVNTWVKDDEDWSSGILLRAYSGSIFSYFNQISAGTNRWGGDAYYKKAWYTRAVIIVGQGV